MNSEPAVRRLKCLFHIRIEPAAFNSFARYSRHPGAFLVRTTHTQDAPAAARRPTWDEKRCAFLFSLRRGTEWTSENGLSTSIARYPTSRRCRSLRTLRRPGSSVGIQRRVRTQFTSDHLENSVTRLSCGFGSSCRRMSHAHSKKCVMLLCLLDFLAFTKEAELAIWRIPRHSRICALENI